MPGQTRDSGGLLGASVETGEIDNSAVTTAKIADGAVSFAKIANLNTDVLLGRTTASTGDVEEITVSDFVQTLLNDADAGTFRTSIGAGTGGGDVVASNNLSDLADAGTARTNLGLGGLATKSTVGSSEIDADSVTYDKMQDTSGTDVILGRSTAGAGTVEEITCTSAGRAILDDANANAQRTTLGLAIGSDVQAYDADLAAIAALAKTDSNFIVGNGSAWVAEGAATARTSLGLGGLATVSTVNGSDWSGADLAVADGGTGASTAAAARTNLGLDDIATKKSNLTATTAPVATDDTGSGYAPGSVWVDLTNDKAYVCLDATSTAAVWTETTGAGGGGGDVVNDTTPQLGGDLDCQGYNIDAGGVIFLSEQASADADVAGDGQWWVQTNTPNLPMFTDDAGTDRVLAPVEGEYPLNTCWSYTLQSFSGSGGSNGQFAPGDMSAGMPLPIYVRGEGMAEGSQNIDGCVQFTVPPGYDKNVHTLKLRVRCKENDAANTTHQIDVLAYEEGAGTDICATAAQNTTASYADYDFTITDTNIVAGDSVTAVVRAIMDDTGGAAGAPPQTDVSNVTVVVT